MYTYILCGYSDHCCPTKLSLFNMYFDQRMVTTAWLHQLLGAMRTKKNSRTQYESFQMKKDCFVAKCDTTETVMDLKDSIFLSVCVLQDDEMRITLFLLT